MSLRFVIGRSGSGKTQTCINEIHQLLINDPMGDPIIYLVPDQMTFQSEYELINRPGIKGMIRAQVYSFSRLAWRVLQETGGISRYHLSTVGVSMLLRKIIEHRKSELKVFSKAAEKSGFITHVEGMLTELKRYCIDANELKQTHEQLILKEDQPNKQVLADKLYDLQMIYQDLEAHLLMKYIDSEDYLRLLAEKMAQSSYLQNAHIYVDGFHNYTPQELDVLVQMMKTSKRVSITLTTDEQYDDYPPHDLHLFRMTGRTYQTITRLAKEASIDIESPVRLVENMRHALQPSLHHLEQSLESRPSIPFQQRSNITLYQAVNRRAEVEGVAREITRLVRDEGYRYRDIALFIRNSNDYYDLLDTVFTDHHIPFFIDQKRSMLHHPLIELIRSSLEVVTANWRYDAVFRCVKTDLLFPQDSNINALREEMDYLENYVLAYGIHGDKWTNKKRWEYRRFQGLDLDSYVKTDEDVLFENRVNDLRNLIVPSLNSLQKRLTKAKCGREMCEAIYTFLEELHIPAKLTKMRDEAEADGHLVEGSEHSQVWKAVIDLLDQYVEVLGEEALPLHVFTNIIETGLESMQFALVPPAIDQVLIAHFDRSRYINIKGSFILGVNEGVIPLKPTDEGVLSEVERGMLHEIGVELAPGGREQLLDESFQIYMALSSPNEYLYISYPLANDEGKSLIPSSLINRIKDLYPELEEEVLVGDTSELTTAEEQLAFVTSPTVTLSHVATQLQAWKKGYPVEPLWWDVYNFIVSDAYWKTRGNRVFQSLFYENKEQPLKIETTKKLYGDTIKASVSRMERFKGCPFSHFASHGLKLKERQLFRLEAPDIGQLFHSALKMISDKLRNQHVDWSELSQEQCQLLAIEAVEKLAPRLQNEILLSSNRHHYVKRKLQHVLIRASVVLSEHARASGFTPVGLELPFGAGEELPAITFQLPNETKMELVGRIDRVDKAVGSQGVLLRIVDYKSSAKELNLAEVYYGLALQMLTYLDIVITHSTKWIGQQANPAGVLYFHVHNPMLQTKGKLAANDIEKELLKQFKMKGLLLGDEESIRLMDQSLEVGRSDIVSAGIKKGGGFYAGSSIASAEEFSNLRKHVKNIFTDIGTHIMDGDVSISPYKLKEKTPCTFCSYKPFCQFDESFKENKYRILSDEKDHRILEKISKEVEEND
ncbi:helicase-exonuclease AddAB subunit AddB [Bacillus sp. SM2101]|uniref:helicase-exonuclease AddAB subunit AddB n=1 Tax=Bacillus sp. SM2101 TaxID=2805366 RepID=UPI001BDE328B|nr:helicase-exonuclease AddAB subunit AddB [Bacillus sp. SM2101]